MGTPLFAVPILKSLYQNGYPLSVIYTQPPQKSKRGQKINKSPIQGISETLNLDFRSPITLKDNQEEYKFLRELNADLAVVVAYGQIIPKKYLELTKKGFINIHGSILPKWRGAAPIQRAIMNLDKTTGISIMKIVSKLDAGPTLIKSEIPITDETNYESLSDQMSKLGAIKILEAINLIENKKANFIDQDETEATYAKKIEKIEGKITWKENADKVIAKINALNPNPGSWFMLKGSRIKVLKAVEVKQQGRPGEILSNKFIIACKKNAIQILELKKEGKNKMNVQEYTNGNKLEVGTSINE